MAPNSFTVHFRSAFFSLNTLNDLNPLLLSTHDWQSQSRACSFKTPFWDSRDTLAVMHHMTCESWICPSFNPLLQSFLSSGHDTSESPQKFSVFELCVQGYVTYLGIKNPWKMFSTVPPPTLTFTVSGNAFLLCQGLHESQRTTGKKQQHCFLKSL